MATRKRPTIAITMGDPCGIGPEIVLRALASASWRRRARFLVIGTPGLLRAAARRFGLDAGPLRAVKTPSAKRQGDALEVINACRISLRLLASGKATAAGGAASLEYVRVAVDLAVAGRVDAVVTAPINKYALHLAGVPWPGHTEFLGHLTGAVPIMMMVGGGLRAALVTTHTAMRDVPRQITKTRVLATLTIVDGELRRSFGCAQPRLGVTGLNPHAGDGGRFGDEEARSIMPALAAAAQKGLNCRGPLPADVAFHQMRRGDFDAVVAMYHDQATIPVKTLAFDRGVNVTLGLPIVRTSPDHGTAYDIAPRGVASPTSMRAAIELAIEMARARGRGDS